MAKDKRAVFPEGASKTLVDPSLLIEIEAIATLPVPGRSKAGNKED